MNSNNNRDVPPRTSGNNHIKGDVVQPEKLQLLETDEELKKLLANKHLRQLLAVINAAENSDEIMQKAMQEPLFVEFADACLKVVEPQPKSDDEFL